MKNVERLLNNRILRVRAEIDRLKRELDSHGGRCERLEERIAEAKTELSWLMHLGGGFLISTGGYPEAAYRLPGRTQRFPLVIH